MLQNFDVDWSDVDFSKPSARRLKRDYKWTLVLFLKLAWPLLAGMVRARGSVRTKRSKCRVCACIQRPGAAAPESLRQDRLGELTLPAFSSTLTAAPVLYAHAVVTVARNKPFWLHQSFFRASYCLCDVEKGALLVVPRLLQVLVIVMNSSQSTRQPFVDGQRLGANSAGARVVRASPSSFPPLASFVCLLVS